VDFKGVVEAAGGGLRGIERIGGGVCGGNERMWEGGSWVVRGGMWGGVKIGEGGSWVQRKVIGLLEGSESWGRREGWVAWWWKEWFGFRPG
jgi:hypothetical protein